MKIHELKTDREVFQPLYNRQKNFEIRYNDRGFKPSDLLHLRETAYSGHEMKNGKPLQYTGRELVVAAEYIMHGPIYGLAEDWVIMSISGIRFSIT